MAEVWMEVREKSSRSRGASPMHLCRRPPDRGREGSRDYREGSFRDDLSKPEAMEVVGAI
jgi:hypothetical protein